MAKQTGRARRRPPLITALDTDAIRKTELDGRTLYALPDVLAQLTGSDRAEGLWEPLRRREPSLEEFTEEASFPSRSTPGTDETLPATTLEGLLRIAQSAPTPRAETVKRWIAATCVEGLEEAANPELAVARARRAYEAQGLPRQWIDGRLRSISARAEVVGEWYRRGAQTSDDFRTLTNALMQEAFGMDVETYRQHKGLFGRENLRDHMTDLELALVSLGETVAATLHRSKGSKTLQELEADMTAAGAIVAATRKRIEKESGRGVIEGERKSWGDRRTPPNPKDTPASNDQPGRQVLYKRAEHRTS
jgi:hypothetical protein